LKALHLDRKPGRDLRDHQQCLQSPRERLLRRAAGPAATRLSLGIPGLDPGVQRAPEFDPTGPAPGERHGADQDRVLGGVEQRRQQHRVRGRSVRQRLEGDRTGAPHDEQQREGEAGELPVGSVLGDDQPQGDHRVRDTTVARQRNQTADQSLGR
jgi:hypothetical protein